MGAKSHTAGHFYLAPNPHPLNYNKAPNNGPFHNKCKILKHVVCSVVEAEIVGPFGNCQSAMELCNILTALGCPQTATCVNTDKQNS
eukprot:2528379-Ditylum_brightwellii.AAC.1